MWPDSAAGTEIGDYGMVGDTRTAALIGPDGSLDWLCAPRFDATPFFGRLVGGEEAGSFVLAPAGEARVVARRYRPGSPVLETVWRGDGVEAVVTEGMVAEVAGRLLPSTLVVRMVEARGGPVRMRVRVDPRRGVERSRPRVERRHGALVCTWGASALAVQVSEGTLPEPGVDTEVTVEPGRPAVVSLAVADREPLVLVPPRVAEARLRETDAWWRSWSEGIPRLLPGDERHEAVARSMLVLRLLTYSPSGAPVAAPTTSLPEAIGGDRNWDYRYAWPRDAAIGIAAAIRLDKGREADAFLAWLLHAGKLDRPKLPPVLTLHGRHVPAERELEEWPGYAGSRPVRLGNGAREQHQLDVYGWVVDAAWAVVRAERTFHAATWRATAAFADYVADHWREPDAGIWEVRGEPRHYVHSKLMGWLALDRALRMAAGRRVREARRRRWATARDELGVEVRARGVDAGRTTYVRSYGADDLDAALLLLPLVGLEPVDSPAVRGTIDAVRRELGAGGPLLHRYRRGIDLHSGAEGAFLPCSFWLAQALAATGRVEEALEVFDALLPYAGPLGLFSEEVDPDTGALLGNYPQALTHAALIQAALAIHDARGQ